MEFLDEVLENVKAWAIDIGKMQIKKMNETLMISNKSNSVDYVTETDLLSEKILIENINKYFPEHSILSEEKGSVKKESDYTWIIDPLDGTTNYVHKYPIFSVSIALKYKDEIMLGVVYVPMLNELFYAIKGKGAYLNGNKIRVSDSRVLETALLATGFPYDKSTEKEDNVDIFNNFIKRIACIRRSGSAAFDLCSIACGRIDGYWELKLNAWDIAAGELIVSEAGGEVQKFYVNKKINVIAGNGEIINIIRKSIKEVSNYFEK